MKPSEGPYEYAALAGLDPKHYTILLHGIDVSCCKCGLTPEIPDLEGLNLAVAVQIALRSRIEGTALRFLRKVLGSSQEEFGSWIDVKGARISQLEGESSELPPRLSVFLRLHVLRKLGHLRHAQRPLSLPARDLIEGLLEPPKDSKKSEFLRGANGWVALEQPS